MAKVRNEGNRSKQLSFAAQTSPRTPLQEKVLRDFNSPGQRAEGGKQVDGTATKGYDRGEKLPEVARKEAQQKGQQIHKQVTQPNKNDGPSR
jgi:hypothetical protein